MSTYLIKSEKTITRQEGDVADIVITVPALLSLSGMTAKFQVSDNSHKIVISKLDDDIAINDQVINIPLLPEDTEGFAGKFRWELQVVNEDGPITIGKGPFNITGTDIKPDIIPII